MSFIVPVIASSVECDVGVASAQFTGDLVAGTLYRFCSNTACWIIQGTGAQTATKTAGSMFVGAGERVMLDPKHGVEVAVIRDAADGKATITPIRFVR